MNVLFNWAGMGLAIVFGFLQAPIVVAGLGHTWYGVWVLVNQLTSYTWLFDIGIREGVVRFVSRHRARGEIEIINEIVSSAVALYVSISAVTVALVSAAAMALPYVFTLPAEAVGEARLALMVVGFNIAINWSFNPYTGVLLGLQRFDLMQKVGMFTSTAQFILVIWAMRSGHGIVTLALISAGASLVSGACVLWNCRRLVPELALVSPHLARKHVRALVGYGKYVFINNLGIKVVHGSGVVLTGIFLPVGYIAFYAIPSQLINYMGNIVATASQVLNPLTSSLDGRQDSERVRDVAIRGMCLSLTAAAPIGVVFLLMGRQFLSLWIGEEFGRESATVLACLVIPAVIGAVRHPLGNVLYGTSRHHVAAYVQIGEALVNVALTLLFVRWWGVVGVAAAMGVAHLVFMGGLLPILGIRELGIGLKRYLKEALIPPVIAAVPFAMACAAVNAAYPASNLIVFFGQVLALLPVYLLPVWYLCLSDVERAFVLRRFVNRTAPLNPVDHPVVHRHD